MDIYLVTGTLGRSISVTFLFCIKSSASGRKTARYHTSTFRAASSLVFWVYPAWNISPWIAACERSRRQRTGSFLLQKPIVNIENKKGKERENQMRTRKWKKRLSALLCTALLLGMQVSMSVNAEDAQNVQSAQSMQLQRSLRLSSLLSGKRSRKIW